MLIIGELINSTRTTVEQALQGKDEATIRRLARDQVAGGAQVLDINAATSLKNEVPDTEWLVDVVQDEFPEIRLAIDTPNPEAMIAGLKRCTNRPFLNSVTNEKSREDMFSLVAQFGANVIGLTLGLGGMPNTVEDRLHEGRNIVKRLERLGVERERIYLDPVVMPVANRQEQTRIVTESIRRLKAEFPGVKTSVGLSNISFGLPHRFLINHVYLTLLLEAGLDAALIDPTDRDTIDTIKAIEALLGDDPGCLGYVKYTKQVWQEEGKRTPARIRSTSSGG